MEKSNFYSLKHVRDIEVTENYKGKPAWLAIKNVNLVLQMVLSSLEKSVDSTEMPRRNLILLN